MKPRDPFKLPTLFCLYIAQSIPMAFFSTVLPVIMRQEQYSLSQIGLLQLIKLPWIVKLLWAPVVDHHARDYTSLRRWIILSELFYACIILGIGLLELKTNFGLILLLVILSFAASATQDIAVDKYAILSLRGSERGLGNSMQAGGSFVGSLFGTGVLLVAYHHLGWQWVLSLLAMFIVLAVLPLWLRRRRDRLYESAPRSRRSINLRDIPGFFTSLSSKRHILLLLLYYSGIIGVMAMVKPFMVDLGYSTERIAVMLGVFGSAVAALCAMAGGLLLRRMGHLTALASFLCLSLTAALFYWYISLGIPSEIQMYVAIAWVWGAYGLSSVGIYTLAMDRVRPELEGTDFTIQIMITHLSGLIVAALSGRMADAFGYTALFGVEAVLSLLALLVLWSQSRSLEVSQESQII